MACPFDPDCDPCPPPGGLIVPHDKAVMGGTAIFLGWENNRDYAALILSISPDGLQCTAKVFTPENNGEYLHTLPLVSPKHEEKRFRSEKAYLEERVEFQEIVRHHMAAFEAEWMASGTPLPEGGFIRWGNGTGEYIVPRQEGRDCRADVFREVSPGIVDIRLLYRSGRGASNAYGVQVLTPELADQAKALRAQYVAMREPHWQEALEEWGREYL